MSMSLQMVTHHYLDFLETGLNRSPHTVQHYRDSLALFERFRGNPMISQITLEDTLNFSKWLRNRPGFNGSYSTSSIYTRMTDLKSFFKWISERTNFKTVDWRFIVIPHGQQHRIEFIQPDEFEKLIRVIPDNTFEGKRLRASVEVLMSTGCRLQEFIDMKKKDVKPDGSIIVKGKGGVYGTVYISKRAMIYLERYLRKRDDNSPWLWISRRENGVHRLQRSVFQQQLKRLGEKAELSKRIHPHIFRHTFGTTLLHNGANMRQVQMLMRHKRITSTEVYTHYVSPDLKEAHHKYLKV